MKITNILVSTPGHVPDPLVRRSGTRRRIKVLPPLLLCLTCLCTHGQTAFQGLYGSTADDVGYAVQQTADGGYIIGGYTTSFAASGMTDAYLIRTDAGGNYLWSKVYGGTGSDAAYSVQQTADGGFIMAGFTDSYSGTGYQDVYLIKTNSAGSISAGQGWTKTFGGTNHDYANMVRQTSDGGYAIAGATRSYGGGIGNTYDAYLLKTSSDGTLLWTKCYGGTGSESANAFVSTTDGGYILTGFANTYTGYDYDSYLLKTNSAGDISAGLGWAKTFGGTGEESGAAVRQTADGGYIFTGYTTGFGISGSSAIYLVKCNSGGGISWTKIIDAGSGSDNIPYSLSQTTDGGFIITGYTNANASGSQDIYLVKTASDGSLQWRESFGGTGADDECAYSVQQTTDGGYILTGYTMSFNVTGQELYLVKTDASGASGGCNQIASPNPALSSGGGEGSGATMSSGGSSGTGGTATSVATVAQTACGALPVSVVSFKGKELDNSIILEWKTISETNSSYFLLEKSIDGINFETAGRMKGAGNSTAEHNYSITDPTPFSALSRRQEAGEEVFYRLQQFDYDGQISYRETISVMTEVKALALKVYPGPEDDKIYFEFYAAGDSEIRFTVSDMPGHTLLSETAGGARGNNNFSLSTRSLSPGMYLLEVSSPAKRMQAKFLKQ